MNLGAAPSQPSQLARIDDRLSFVYLEHAVIGREDNALTATTADGVLHVPSAGLLVLMLGPGISVTHQAMMVIADSGMSVVWVGEEGVRTYASGRPLARTSRFVEAQARIVSNSRLRIALARRMYAMRFPGEDVSKMSMQQLRGREGARVRKVYRQWSDETGVPWERRDYDAEDFDSSDAVNQALSAANACMYGVVHAACAALGCAPGLGVVHTGHDRSFVFDIADIYKAEFSIPVAFQTVARTRAHEGEMSAFDLGGEVRRAMRDRFRESRLVERVVKDIRMLLSDSVSDEEDSSLLELWDDKSGSVAGGINHSPWEDMRP